MFYTFLRRLSGYALLPLLSLALSATEANGQLNSIKSDVTIGGPNEEPDKGFLIATDDYVVTATLSHKGTGMFADSIGALVTKLDHNKKILWERYINWSGAFLRLKSIIQTKDNGFLVATTLSLEPGSGKPNFMLHKLDGNGKTIWEKISTPDSNVTDIISIAEADDGKFVMISNKQIATGDRLQPYRSSQLWMGLINSDGALMFEKQLTNNHIHLGSDLKKSTDGNFVVAGDVTDLNDLANIGGGRDAFILKFNQLGTVLWNKYYGAEHFVDLLYELCITPAGDIIAAGISSSQNLYGIKNHGYSDGWLLKISSSGEIIWSKLIGGTDTDYFYSVALGSDGSITAGGQGWSSDGDLPDNLYKESIWLTRIKENNTQIENGFFGGGNGNYDAVSSVAVTPAGRTFFVATADSKNKRKSVSIGLRDLWLVETGVSNKVRMEAFLDANSNGQRDPGERAYTGGKLQVTNINSAELHKKSSSFDGFLCYLESGSYEFKFFPGILYYIPQPSQILRTYPDQTGSDTIYFAVQPVAGNKDLAITIVPLEFPRPGFDGAYQLTYKNNGTDTITTPSVQFKPSAKFVASSSLPAFSSKQNDTLIWNLPSIKPMEQGTIIVKGKFLTPPSMNFGDTLPTTAIINPISNDRNLDDNLATIAEIAQGSFDPNDKTEFHAGFLSVENLNKERLIYMVRFQNTGTDTAFNIKIRDTLHSNLDWNSVQMISSSHTYILDIKNNNQLEWQFANIKLPDSNRNEPASHGFVLYSVKPKSGLVAGDSVSNSASIYFDFNQPIITNETFTRVTQLAKLPQPILGGIQQEYCGSAPKQNIRVVNAAMAGTATITILLNNKMLPVTADGNFQISPDSLTAGLQNLVVSFISGATRADLSQTFKIIAPVKPIVKLGSNVSAVNNGTTAVLLSATNNSGGGKSPLYTFSTTRDFTRILQAESTQNTLAIMSQLLTPGENWIYVRMKTNESCYTTPTSLDSIKLVRTAVTSIVDLNFPGSVIVAYPNPVSSTINLKGFQGLRNYRLQIVNALGNVVATMDISGSTTATFDVSRFPSGKYFINVYNKMKGQLIGSLVVIKI